MTYRLLNALLILSLLNGFILAGLGIAQTQIQEVSQAQQAPIASYTQDAPPESQLKVLQPFDNLNGNPMPVYCNGKYVPWTSFTRKFPGNTPIFWISASSGWLWHASTPLGSWVQELLYLPDSGSIEVYETYPTGITKMYNYGFASEGCYYIWFNADVPGRHAVFFTINDQPSNAVMIDVF